MGDADDLYQSGQKWGWDGNYPDFEEEAENPNVTRKYFRTIQEASDWIRYKPGGNVIQTVDGKGYVASFLLTNLTKGNLNKLFEDMCFEFLSCIGYEWDKEDTDLDETQLNSFLDALSLDQLNMIGLSTNCETFHRLTYSWDQQKIWDALRERTEGV